MSFFRTTATSILSDELYKNYTTACFDVALKYFHVLKSGGTNEVSTMRFLFFIVAGICITASFASGQVSELESIHATSSFSWTYFTWAVLLGGLSAFSLFLGSIVGVYRTFPKRIIGALAAFGAGALLAALSVELVAPTMMTLSFPELRHFTSESIYASPIALLVGMILGGILFVTLDQVLNAHGGYLRKTATTLTYLSKSRTERFRSFFEKLHSNPFFRKLPSEQLHNMVSYLRPVTFPRNQTVFEEGAPGDRMFFITDGKVRLTRSGAPLAELSSGDIFGEISLVANSPRTAQATTQTAVHGYELSRHDFERLKSAAPELEEATREIAGQRLGEIGEHDEKIAQEAAQWARQASSSLRNKEHLPTPLEIRAAASKHGGAPLAIWLGIFLDGIPESLVIGMGMLTVLVEQMMHGTPTFASVFPFTLIAGLFLSNFPEALSSSAGMRAQGWSRIRVLTLWTSLMIMTAVGAGIGYSIGADMPHALEIFIEGIAAGSMLTMIAQTMIPEAVHLGGATVTGLSTLIGFLSAIAFKLLETV